MFGCNFNLDSGMVHHTGKDFDSEAEAIHYAEQSLEVSPNYASATITHKLFPILTVEG